MTEEMKKAITAKNLAVGYDRKIIVSGIEFAVRAGEIVTLIGPNGCGKSTLLKTITGALKVQDGQVFLGQEDLAVLKEKDIATRLSMVMTNRISPELMSAREVVATGRFPYTGRFGILSKEDWEKVDGALSVVGGTALAKQDFSTLSDGQKQRVMLARALCQDTDLLILDEPTSFLDMGYKLELLKIVRRMADVEHKAILMSLHELDLARAVSDCILCVKDGALVKAGTPDEVYQGNFLQHLFGVAEDEFDPATGCMILKRNL